MSPQESQGAGQLARALKLLRKSDIQTDTKKGKEEKIEARQALEKAVKALEKEGQWPLLGMALHFLKELSASDYPYFMGVVPGEAVCEQLEKNCNQIDKRIAKETIARAKNLRTWALDTKKKAPYLMRQRFLEEAIRIVWELCKREPSGEDYRYRWPYEDPWDSTAAFQFVARCYLERGRLVLPKGSSIPEKKLEAFHKAWEWAKRAEQHDSNIESAKLLIEIGLERERYDGNFSKDHVAELIKELKGAGFSPSNTSPLDWEIVDRGCSAEILDKKLDEALFNLDLSVDPLKDNLSLPLLKARAGLRILQSEKKLVNENEVCKRATMAIEALKSVPFSQYLWDESIDLLNEIKNHLDNWADLPIRAWEICTENEKKVPLGLQLRLYWTRHANLYDLAFYAALSRNNLKLAAKIADSLKSRPTIKWLNIEKGLEGKQKKTLEELHEIETLWAVNRYLTDYQKRTNALRDRDKVERQQREISNVPNGWAAIHFYLDQNRVGHAIIFNGDSKILSHEQFDLINDDEKGIDLWEKFKAWQEADRYANERHVGEFLKASKEASPYLKEFCLCLGKKLSFLFKEELPDNLILIPHSFLHLAPIHAANDEDDGKLLLEKKACLYLPAWSLAPTSIHGQVLNGRALFMNWTDSDAFQEIYKKWPNTSPENLKKEKAKAEDVKNYLENINNPALIAIISHGQADQQNPYNSRLILKGKDLRHSEIVSLKNASMKGTKVILVACESDLAPSRQSYGDEHLSMAAAFLGKDASEIAGTLWKAADKLLAQVLESILNDMDKKPLFQLIREKQKGWRKSGIVIKQANGKEIKITQEGIVLYLLSPFRVIGFPQTYGERNETE